MSDGGIRRRIYLGFKPYQILNLAYRSYGRNNHYMERPAFIFPGQGSQIVGMGKDLFESYPMAREMYTEADKILGIEISRISFEGPEETLKQTQYTQPALYVHSMIVSALIQERGLRGAATAGHSLGEFSALAFAGVYDFETGLKLVQKRAQLMKDANKNNSGMMAALIGLDSDTVIRVCERAKSSGMVQPANFNSPGQIVISGLRAGVEKAMELAKAEGAKRVLELPVTGAFHSPLMKETADLFSQELDALTFKKPSVPVYSNVTAEKITSSQSVSDLLYRQLTHSVRWIETIQNMVKDGISEFIEIGAGRVLAGLVKRIDNSVEILSLGTREAIQSL